jgi:cation transport ATPase
VVILIDKVERVAEAVAIAQRTHAIARQSMVVGLGLSGIAILSALSTLVSELERPGLPGA